MEDNVWRPAHLTPEQVEERRLTAAVLLRQGQLSQAEIARHLGSAAPVSAAGPPPWPKWARAAWKLAHPGTIARLDEKAWARLSRLLDRGAMAAGFATERWTLERIAALIEREFRVIYHPRYLKRPLKAHGFSVQRPATRAKERDELVIAVWPKRDWVALKKRRARSTGPWSSGTRPATASGSGRARPGRGAG
jgi:putative transposase